ncbi:LamG domain-containing protein [Micromonospora globbae]|uniref:LamG domain-containing protein n=1 Tax=Micromonospora globbae TaxID=1894969 RepID=UPI0037B35BAC
MVVAASGVVAPGAVAAAEGPDVACHEEVPSEAGALAAAVACGQPVAVGASRSEYVQVVAQPDGRLSFESAVEPQRARRSDGSWADVDLRLRRGEDGLLRPAVSVADVVFSGGGSAPMVTLWRAGKSLSLSWPGSLPVPVVSGDSATYPNVLPDVDLVVRATSTGFTHVLVVKSAQAAANPQVRTISFGVGGDADLSRRPDGSLQAVAGTTVVAEAERAVMWESSAPAAQRLQAAASTPFMAGDGARTASVDARLTDDGDLELVPDETLLSDPAVTFPVFVDPAWSVAQSKWAYATSNGCTNTDYSVARVGLSPEGPCIGARFRSFFQFATTNGTVSLKGKYIHSAYVQMELNHSWSCDNTWAHMYLTPAINDTMKASWSSMSLSKWLDSAEGHANKGTGCSDSPQKDMTMNFEGPTVTGQVQTAASKSWNTITVGFCACNEDGEYESTQSRWKKFYPAKAKLVVDYDSVPGKPTGLRVAGVACPTSGVLTVGTLTPTFSAVYPDADSGQTLTGAYEWVEVPSGGIGTVTDTYPTRLTPPPRPPATANGRATTAAVSVVKGKTYAFRVTAVDPAPYSQWSGWSVWCQFAVDTTVPPVTVTMVTPPAGPGQPGKFLIKSTATDVTSFKYGWNAPTTVVTATGTSPKTATVTATAPRYGTNILYVSAVDATLNQGFGSIEFAVGRPSPPVARWGLETYPGQTQTQALEDKQPSLTGNTPLTASNVTWQDDARLIGGQTAAFNGSSSHLSTTTPILDVTKSFSVAAWVRLGAPGAPLPTSNKAAVVQDGDRVDSFVLGYQGGTQTWNFWIHGQDSDGSTWAGIARGSVAPVAGRWTHLAGSYDATSGMVYLYVDGELAGSARTSMSPQWSTTRRVAIGRELWNGASTSFWSGQIADVQLFDRVLVDHDFTGQLASDPSSGGVNEPGMLAPIEVGRWDFESARPCYFQDREDTCQAADGTPFDRWLALNRGADAADGNRGNGLHLDGYYFAEENPEPWEETFEWARSAAKVGLTPPDEDGNRNTVWQHKPVLRTDQSFTVSAWVRMDRTDRYQAVLAQDGTANSGFYLYYGSDDGGMWKFKMLQDGTTVDSGTNPGATIVQAPASAVMESWHHLAGVLDAGRRELRLYVDGELKASAPLKTAWQPWQAAGALTVGRSFGGSNLLHGAVDDVGVFQGAMTDAQVMNLYDSQAAEGSEI